MGLKAWDVSAGGLIVQVGIGVLFQSFLSLILFVIKEAGGVFTDMEGKTVQYGHAKSENDKFAILGSNGLLHTLVLDQFELVRKQETK